MYVKTWQNDLTVYNGWNKINEENNNFINKLFKNQFIELK